MVLDTSKSNTIFAICSNGQYVQPCMKVFTQIPWAFLTKSSSPVSCINKEWLKEGQG